MPRYKFETNQYGSVIGNRALIEGEVIHSALGRTKSCIRTLDNRGMTRSRWKLYVVYLDAALSHNLNKVQEVL